jgi:hypothetical protein
MEECKSDSPRKQIRGIDSNIAYELAPTTSTLTGSLELYRLNNDGGIEGYQITVPFEDLPSEKYFSIQLINRKTDTTIFQADHCSVESQNWQTSAKGIVTGSVSFTAISWQNEFAKLKE